MKFRSWGDQSYPNYIYDAWLIIKQKDYLLLKTKGVVITNQDKDWNCVVLDLLNLSVNVEQIYHDLNGQIRFADGTKAKYFYGHNTIDKIEKMIRSLKDPFHIVDLKQISNKVMFQIIVSEPDYLFLKMKKV